MGVGGRFRGFDFAGERRYSRSRETAVHANEYQDRSVSGSQGIERSTFG